MAKFNLKPLEQNEVTQYSHNNIFSWKSQLDLIHLYLVLNKIMVDFSNPQYLNTEINENLYKNTIKHFNFNKYMEIKFFKKIKFSINCNINLYNSQKQLLVYFKFLFFKTKNMKNVILKRTYLEYNYKFYENYIEHLYSKNIEYLITENY